MFAASAPVQQVAATLVPASLPAGLAVVAAEEGAVAAEEAAVAAEEAAVVVVPEPASPTQRRSDC